MMNRVVQSAARYTLAVAIIVTLYFAVVPSVPHVFENLSEKPFTY